MIVNITLSTPSSISKSTFLLRPKSGITNKGTSWVIQIVMLTFKPWSTELEKVIFWLCHSLAGEQCLMAAYGAILMLALPTEELPVCQHRKLFQ